MSKKLLIIISILFTLFIVWFIFLKDIPSQRLMKEGSEVIQKIEIFKTQNKRLPNALSELGIVESESDRIFYEKRTDTYYVVYFNIGFDDIKAYHSDSKKWEDVLIH